MKEIDGRKCVEVFHGTSIENWMIMTNLERRDGIKTNFAVSDEKMIYFYLGEECTIGNPAGIKVIKNGWSIGDGNALLDAFNSAVKTAAIKDSIYNFVVVLRFLVPEDLLTYDISCMDYAMDNHVQMDRSKFSYKDMVVSAHFFKYYRDKRYMYLYNAYHSTCGINWDWVKPNVKHLKTLEEDIAKSGHTEPEIHFEETQLSNSLITVQVNDVLSNMKSFAYRQHTGDFIPMPVKAILRHRLFVRDRGLIADDNELLGTNLMQTITWAKNLNLNFVISADINYISGYYKKDMPAIRAKETVIVFDIPEVLNKDLYSHTGYNPGIEIYFEADTLNLCHIEPTGE